MSETDTLQVIYYLRWVCNLQDTANVRHGHRLLYASNLNSYQRVVMAASALPDPEQVSYDLLLSCVTPDCLLELN